MATFTGFGAEEYSLEAFCFQCDIRQPEFTEPYFDHDGSDFGYSYSPEPMTGVVSKAPFTALEQSKAGVIVPSFSLDFYNRIHVSPNPVEFGSITQEKTATVEIWNAFFDSAEYTDQVVAGFDGLALGDGAYPPPTVSIPALFNYSLPIVASVDGPGTISATLQLVITGKPIEAILITGRRSKLFPFITSWDANPIETFEYKTNIVETEQWTEYRYRNRAYPRRAFQLGVAAAGRGDSDLRISLMTSQGAEYALPVWMYETKLTSQVLPGDNRIYVGTADSDFVAGEGIMFLESQDRFEVVNVIAVGNDYVDVDPANGPGQLWQIGTLAYPVRQTKFTDTISLTSPTGNVSRATVNLDTLISERNFAAQNFPTYKGSPVMTWMPNWKSGGKVAYVRRIETVDNGIYPVSRYLLSTNYGEEQDFEWLLRNRTEVHKFRNLMHYLAGRHKPFWMPSWHNDFPIAEDYSIIEPVLYVNSAFATKFLQANPAMPLHLRILTKDGTQHFCEVEDATPDPAFPTRDKITLTEFLPNNFVTYWVEDLSQMNLVRLASDAYEIEWYTPQVAMVKLTVVRVPEQPPIGN